MPTALDIIKRALRKVGAIDAIEAPTDEETSDALGSINDILGEWSITRGLVVAQAKVNLPLVAGQQVYTLGLTGDLDIERPIRVEAAYLGASRQAVAILPIEYFNAETERDQQGTPTIAYTRYANPLVDMTLHPVPATSENLELLLWQPVDQITDIYAELDMPPYLATYLRICLQIDTAPDYGRPISPEWVSRREGLRNQISAVHGRRQRTVFDPALLRHSSGFRDFNNG